MKLSDTELSRLRQWEKYRKIWRRLRWFCFLVGMVQLIVGFWMLSKLMPISRGLSGDAEILARSGPLCMMALCSGGVWLGITLICWRDDLKTRLLHRLLAEHENTDA